MRNFIHSLTVLLLLVLSANQLSAQYEYVFPLDHTSNHLPTTAIILRNGQFMDPNSLTSDLVTLTGSKSGVIPATILLSTDGKTVCITPATPFAYNENVTVNVKDGLKTLNGQILSGTTLKFSVRPEMTMEQKQQLDEYLSTHDDGGYLINDPNQKTTYVPAPVATIRGTPLPSILIYNNTNPSDGKIFFNRNSGTAPQTSAERGYGIIEPNGDSVFYRSTNVDGINFHLNYNGMLTAYHQEFAVDTDVIELDASYNVIDHVHCGNGLRASQHEHIFLPDGSKIFTVYDWQIMDLTQFGGSSQANVNVSWIQKLDANNNVTFQWRSSDHFQVTDATPDISLSTTDVDPWHVNALYVEADGSIIASFRNMDRVIKINTNGTIKWQWGGLKSTYNEITTTGDPDGGFSHQHNVHRIENGHILMLDNGNSQAAPNQVSKAKEYILDEVNLSANCNWYYTHPQVNGLNMFTKNQGSVTRLPNGNTLIGYGLPNYQGFPNGTEIDVNKNIVWEFRFKDSTEYSYRVYKGDNNVGIAHLDASSFLNIFPNPANGIIHFTPGITMENATVSVLNLLGQTVYSETVNSNLSSVSLDLSSLDKGFYLVQIISGEKKMTGRVLLQ